MAFEFILKFLIGFFLSQTVFATLGGVSLSSVVVALLLTLIIFRLIDYLGVTFYADDINNSNDPDVK